VAIDDDDNDDDDNDDDDDGVVGYTARPFFSNRRPRTPRLAYAAKPLYWEGVKEKRGPLL
jgi:hypothetical protein